MREVPPELGDRVWYVGDVPSVPPWVDANRIRASLARDVIERRDQRTYAERQADAMKSRATLIATLGYTPKFTFSTKPKVAKPRPKKERTDETRAYFREYQRRLRAKAKAEAASTA